ncbi:MAG: prolyl oligopeptidase family serine peptidase [Bacillota bacterium]
MTKRPLSAEDLMSLRCSGDARLSPDSKTIVYVTQTHDKEKEKSETHLCLASVEDGRVMRLTAGDKDRSPRWSPDGRRIAFVSDRSGQSQIWVIDLSGGEAYRLPTKESVQSEPTWAPDGKRIYFASNAFSKPSDWVPYPGAPESDRSRAEDQARRALTPKGGSDRPESGKDGPKPNDIKVITRLRYRFDGTGYFGDLRRHVFSVPVPDSPPAPADGLATQVTSGDFDHNLACVTPDGAHIIVSAVREDDADYRQNGQLWAFPASGGRPALLYDAPGPVMGAQISPDGNWLAFVGHDRKRGVSTRSDLWVLEVGGFLASLREGKRPLPLTASDAVNVTAPLDRHAGGMAGSEPRYGGFGPSLVWDEGSLYFPLEDHAEVFICKTSAPSWQVTRVFGQEGRAMSSYDLKSGVLVFTASTTGAPEDIFVQSGGAVTRITRDNDDFMAQVAVGKSEKFSYHAPDGQELDGWAVYPPGYEEGRKYPTVLLVHGGPHGAYSSAFMFGAQFFASNGYAVIYCNPRGSISYGQEFMACIDGDWGNKDYTDVLACVDAAIAKGFVDEDNLFLHGWSYGGYWTVWAVTQTSRFKAACAGACVSNLHSDYSIADIMWSNEHEYGGKPWEKADLLLERSALSHVANVTTPVLLLHGENDLRCPIANSEQFYVALRRLGKTAVMVRYPDEYHGFRRPLHRVDRYQRILSWFDHYRQITR